MTKLFYGNGVCTIEGNASGVEIHYEGAIEIDDKTPDGCFIVTRRNGIVIASLESKKLNKLFEYVGEFKILSVIVANDMGENEPCMIKRVMDYSEFLNSTSETMTTKTEDMNSGYISGKKIAKTVLKQPILPNLHTKTGQAPYNMELYLEDGSLYEGAFHIHLTNSKAMTGATHTEDSQDLYYKKNNEDKIHPTKRKSFASPAFIDSKKTYRTPRRKRKPNKSEQGRL
ncbi:hypothetical protein CL634_08250 [bacterium]|nr:hypothetical protein [bacterium]|tara:strand:+ start:1194 stop:1877 length:684 start_codon:yes stop_codon:yes gene_type:complete